MGEWLKGRTARRVQAGRRWAQFAVVAFALALLGTALAWSGVTPLASIGGSPQRVSAAANGDFARLDASPTDTPTATNTPTPPPTATAVPVTFSLVSPSAASGPVGAQVTVSGAHWGHGAVSLGAASGSDACNDTSSWVASFPSASPSGGSGTFTKSFIWPVSLNSVGTTYYICATNSAGTSSVAYSVDSSSPPVISLSSGSVQVGSQVTITGNNFFTSQPIFVNLQSASGTTRSLGTVSAGPDGVFSYQYTAVPLDAGALTVIAVTQQEGQAPPSLQASANLNVLAAASPTVTASQTPSTSSTPQAGVVPGPSQQNGGSSGALIVGLVAIMALILAIVAGVFIFLMLRRRDEETPPQGGGWQGSNGGPGGYGGAWGQSYSNPNLPFPDDVTQPEHVGAVGQWNDEPDGPGPDWHGRSLSTRPRMPAVETHDRIPDQRTASGPTPYGAPAPNDPWGNPPQTTPPWQPVGGQPGTSWGQAGSAVPPPGAYGQPNSQTPPPGGAGWGPGGTPRSQGVGGALPGLPNAQPFPRPPSQPSSQPAAPVDPWSQDGNQETDQDPWRNNPWGNPPGGQGRR